MNEAALYILAALSAAKSGRVPYYTQPLTNAELEKAIIELGKDIDKKVAAIFRYKGSVADENSLPANAEIGDCYNVESTGANYAWNGSTWDKLSETIDLSSYVTNDSLTTILGSYYSKEEIDQIIENLPTTDSYTKSETDELLAAKADKTELIDSYTKQESDAKYLTSHQDISGKIDKLSELTTAELGTIVQYVGETDTYKKGYFYKYVGAQSVTFTPKQGVETVVSISLQDFKTFITTMCEGRPFTAADVTHGSIGYYSTGRYSFSAVTDEGKFFHITQTIEELQQAGFSFVPELGAQQGVSFVCNLATTDWVQVNVQPQPNLSTKADVSVVVDIENNVTNISNKVNTNSGNITSLQDRINALENRVIDISKSNIEVATIEDGVTLNDTTKDYVISADVSVNGTVRGKSIELKDNEVDNARLTLESTGDITLSGVDYVGSYDKSVNPGNAMTSVRSDGYVVIKDCTLTPTNAYNGIEIGLSTGLAKNVLIDNVKFEGKFTNNAISIFGTADNAIITISNCTFKDVSNAIRLSNRNNVRCTVNLINCKIESWGKGAYAGAILLQDYTSSNASQAQENNLFSSDKITINIQNLITPTGEKLEVSDVSTICGVNNDNQVIYIYNSYEGVLPYDANRYPTINIL